MAVDKQTIDDINSRHMLLKTVSWCVPVFYSSGYWWARCPFHSDVNDRGSTLCIKGEKDFWYCFGCHRGGSVYQFIMYVNKCTFEEAVEVLSKWGKA